MKKIAILSFACLILLTGCAKKVKCTNGDYTFQATVKKDKVVKMKVTVKYDDKDEAKASCKAAKADKDASKVKCKSKSVSAVYKIDKDEQVTEKQFKQFYCKD